MPVNRTVQQSAWAITCFALANIANQAAADSTELILAQNQSPISGVTMVAKERGYFQDHDLDVEVASFTSGREALNSVLGGSAHIATTAESPTTAAAMSGQPIAFLARTEYSDLKTLTRTDSEISSLSDLAGSDIGYASGTGSEVYTSVLLQEAGLDEDDVNLINMRPREMISAIASGSIDAFNIWEPHVANAKESLGDTVQELDTEGVYSETFNIVTMQQYLDENPEVARDFMRALLEAESWIKDNREEAITLIANAADMPRDTLAATWDEYVYNVTIDDFTIEILTKHADWRIRSGNTPSDGAELPPFDEFIFPGPLRDVAPDRVTAEEL